MNRRAWLAVVAAALIVATGAGVFLVLNTGGATTPTEAMGAPGFIEEAETAGVVHTYDGNWTFFVGGGVAVFDCNNDRKPDLYFAGGANPAALYVNESPVGGALRFTGLETSETGVANVTGAYPLDIDSDGHVDLAVLRFGENILFRGLGNCEFERGNELLGFDGGDLWTAGFSATWEGDAALPTLAVGTYVRR